jgi:branched-chain amino acid transport system substrate-binding protein
LVSIALLVAALAVIAAGCGGGDEEAAPPPPAPPAEPAEPPAEPPAETGATDTGAVDTGATDTGATQVDCTANIGIMAPITGPAATVGEEQLNWAKLSVDTYNAERGTTYTLVEGDTQLDPAIAATVAPQMVSDDSVVAVVGPAGSQEIDAVGKIFGDAGMPFISMSATATNLTTTADYPTFFRVVPRDDDQGPTAATYIAEDIGATGVFMIDDQSSYSTGLADETQTALEAAGVTVTRESVSQDQTDFSALVSSIPDDAQVVFLPWQIAANAQTFGEQMAEQGKTQVIFGSDGLFSADFTIDGSYVASFAPDIKGIPEDAELVQTYTDQYGDFGTFGPPTYEAARVVMDAITRVCESGGTPARDSVLAEMRNTDVPLGILGLPIQFDERGDIVERRFYIFQIEGGEYKLLQ